MCRLTDLLMGVVLSVGVVSQPTAQIEVDTAYMSRGVRPFDQPVNPETYLVRPGERLEIVFLQAKLPTLHMSVNAEGRIVHSSLGVIDLSGKTLGQTREILLAPLANLYNAQEIVISIGSIYPVLIQVTGMVNRPGTYVGYTSQRVSEIIDSAGGIAPGGSSRRIKFTGGPVALDVDLDRWRFASDDHFNPNLYAGTRLHVPDRSGAVVQVIGEVATPRSIELLGDESMDEILRLAGGVLPTANLPAAFLLNDPTRDLNRSGALQAGDVLVIPETAGSQLPQVTLMGAVVNPGFYELRDAMTLAQLVDAAEGYLSLANLDRVTVFRLGEKDALGRRAMGRYPFTAGQTGSGSDPVLAPGDSVYVPARLGYVMITGRVARSGMVPYMEGKTVADYIRLVGGYSDSGVESVLEITDRVSGLTQTASPGTVVFDGDTITVIKRESTR